VLKICVSCGSKDVRRKRVSVRLRNGRTVRGVEAHVCDACGERYYDLDAMRRIETEGAAEQ